MANIVMTKSDNSYANQVMISNATLHSREKYRMIQGTMQVQLAIRKQPYFQIMTMRVQYHFQTKVYQTKMN